MAELLIPNQRVAGSIPVRVILFTFLQLYEFTRIVGNFSISTRLACNLQSFIATKFYFILDYSRGSPSVSSSVSWSR